MTSKRVILGAYDALSLLVIATVAYLTLAQPAFAYVDPSIMTYTIQALAGVAVALSTVFAVAFRRVRKKLVKLLGIDENANKEVEGKVQCTADSQVLAQADEQARAYKRGDAARKKGTGKNRCPAASSWRCSCPRSSPSPSSSWRRWRLSSATAAV